MVRWCVRCSRIRGANSSVDKINLPAMATTAARDGKSRPEVVARNQSSSPLSKHNKTSDRGKNRWSAAATNRPGHIYTYVCVCVYEDASMVYRYIEPLCVRLLRVKTLSLSPHARIMAIIVTKWSVIVGKKVHPGSRVVARISGRCMALR